MVFLNNKKLFQCTGITFYHIESLIKIIYGMSRGTWEYTMSNFNNYLGYTAKSYTKEEFEPM